MKIKNNFCLSKQLILASGSSLLFLNGFASTPTKNPDKPNIIYILIDDMGFGDISCYDGNFVPTPNIDRLAKDGVQFYNFYSAAPISSASRAGHLTGMCPAEWNITNFLEGKKRNKLKESADFLSTSAPTIARTFRAAGYTTGHFGKWHVGGGRDVKDAPEFEKYGFDFHSSTYESPEPDPLLTSTNWIWAKTDSVKRWDRTAYFVDRTLELLKNNPNKPCFINLWPDDVHTPWVPDDTVLDNYPKGVEDEKQFKAVLEELDKQIGRLLAGVKNLGIDNNTIIIFTSDNGPCPSFRGSRSGGLRGEKRSLYEGGIRMPFMVRWPGHIPAGKTDKSSVIGAVDMFSSLCKIAKVELPENYKPSGEDMSHAILGNLQKRTKPLYWEYGRNSYFNYPFNKHDVSPNCAVRDGKWKFLINADSTKSELYDLEKDPNETSNMATKYPKITTKLKKQLLTWRASLPKINQNNK